MSVLDFTLVQHSAWAGREDPCFKNAVETRLVTTKKEQDKVKKAGGMLIESGTRAYDLEQEINYPPDVAGLIPKVRGKFARSKIDGMAIYIPHEDDPRD